MTIRFIRILLLHSICLKNRTILSIRSYCKLNSNIICLWGFKLATPGMEEHDKFKRQPTWIISKKKKNCRDHGHVNTLSHACDVAPSGQLVGI